MKLQLKRESIIGLITIFILFTQWSLGSKINSDSVFLYNRACYLLQCLKDGIYPYIYYNAFDNLGYGSSFFYGQLTLLPFLPFTYSLNVFIKVYYLVTLILNYIGVSYFCKRYTKNNNIIAFIYLTSILFLTNTLYCNTLAVGISWFFLAKCVDFFRDEKDYIIASLLFFLILNTHLITALMSFIFCMSLFIYYINSHKFYDYLSFACFTILICSYNIVNYIYHKDSLSFISALDIINDNNYNFTLSKTLFGSNVLRFITVVFFRNNTQHFITLISITILLICLHYLFKTLNINKFVLVIVCFSSFVIGTNKVWTKLLSHLDIIFQFPVRYLIYTLLVFIILCLKDANIKKSVKIFIYIFCLCDIILGQTNIIYKDYKEVEVSGYDTVIGNGEYLSENFIRDINLFKKLKNEAIVVETNEKLDYHYDKNKLIVNIPKHNKKITVRVPKLYYNGYKTNKKEIKCYEGYSQFIEMSILDYSGELEVYYNQPWFLILFKYIVIMNVFIALYRKINFKNLLKKFKNTIDKT